MAGVANDGAHARQNGDNEEPQGNAEHYDDDAQDGVNRKVFEHHDSFFVERQSRGRV